MAKSQETFGKKEKEKKRLKKRQDKQQKLEERKLNATGGGLENMIAYVDENGNITDTPPNPNRKREVIAENIAVSIPKKLADEEPALRKGRLEFFNDSKGYGFIKETGTGESFFVHVNGMIGEVKEGDTVSFELERGLKGMNAVRVNKV
jgi:cold shock CspA family protein